MNKMRYGYILSDRVLDRIAKLEQFEEKHDETAWSVWVDGIERPRNPMTIVQAGEYAESIFDCGYGDEVVEIKPFETGEQEEMNVLHDWEVDEVLMTMHQLYKKLDIGVKHEK